MENSIIYINKSDPGTGETYQDTLKNINPAINPASVSADIKADLQGLYNLTTGTFLSVVLQRQAQIIP